MSIQFQPSTLPVAKHLKLLLWGASGTRKTEAPLRYLPSCAVIDTEGATDLCHSMPEIPPFVSLKTADIYEVIDAIEAIVAGAVKMPDGSPVQTIVIDSMSVLWHVRQEAGLLNAEARVRRKSKGGPLNLDTIDMSFHDWGKAKRPIRQLMNRLNSIPFHVVITARQRDEYAKRPGAQSDTDLVKVGATFDAEKNLDYEVDLALHMEVDRDGKWSCAVSKVRGRMGKSFPVGRRFTEFPGRELLGAAQTQGEISQPPDMLAAAQANAKVNSAQSPKPSMAGLVSYAASLGLGRDALRELLAENGITTYHPNRHQEMIAIIDAHQPAQAQAA